MIEIVLTERIGNEYSTTITYAGELFYSVYIRFEDGHVEWQKDFRVGRKAVQFANSLSKIHNLPVAYKI